MYTGYRIEILRTYLEKILMSSKAKMETRLFLVNHMVCVSQFCAMIALKRGENAELATMAGLLHDIHTLVHLDMDKHAKKGAVIARDVLTGMDLTTDEETDMICSAIQHHSKKKGNFSSFDEVLIDADVLEHGLHNVTIPLREKDRERYEKLFIEFGLNLPDMN
ncbi:MAG: HD domain-containing protein [Oscillospiraceae bacterium]|nr:HD domain-containing protein [Oscillospiraceae bacterium]